MRTHNDYSVLIDRKLYAQTPKAVFAALAVSYLVNHQLEGWEDINAGLLVEWRALREAGLVPQREPRQ